MHYPNPNGPETRKIVDVLKKSHFTRKANQEKLERDGLIITKHVTIHPRERLKRRLLERVKKQKTKQNQ